MVVKVAHPPVPPLLLFFVFSFFFVFFFKKCSFLLRARPRKVFLVFFVVFFFDVVLFFSLFSSLEISSQKTVERCTIKYQLSFFHQPMAIYTLKEDERKNKQTSIDP